MLRCTVFETPRLLVGQVELTPRLLNTHIHAFPLECLWDRVKCYLSLERFWALKIIHFYIMIRRISRLLTRSVLFPLAKFKGSPTRFFSEKDPRTPLFGSKVPET